MAGHRVPAPKGMVLLLRRRGPRLVDWTDDCSWQASITRAHAGDFSFLAERLQSGKANRREQWFAGFLLSQRQDRKKSKAARRALEIAHFVNFIVERGGEKKEHAVQWAMKEYGLSRTAVFRELQRAEELSPKK